MKIKYFKNIKDIKEYILLSGIIFFIFFFFGIFFALLYPSLAQNYMEELSEQFSFLFSLSPLGLGAFIFFNNSIKVLLFMLLGIVFTIPTIFFLILNGWVLGYVVGIILPVIGIQGVLYSVFLHGFFELLGLFIGSGFGIMLGVSFYKEVKRNKCKKISDEAKKLLLSSLRIYFYLILPLLLIAAIIETFIIFHGNV